MPTSKSNLPREFRSWVQLYDFIVDNGFVDHEVMQFDETELHVTATKAIAPTERPKLVQITIREIKDNALDELLQDRYTKKEGLELFSILHLQLYDKMTPQNRLGETLSRLKRIILTQAKNQ